MRTAAIIAEYNPFHNGHHYHIEETRRQTGADYVIIAMSGNFTQRGTPALTDKYTRTRMALLGGADLVLELPVMFAAGSAGDFAFGAVSLLDKLHVVDYLSFGSEAGTLELILQAAQILANEPPVFGEILRRELQNGNSFAKSRFLALNTLLDTPLPEGPNNLLALEYCHALCRRNSTLTPVTVTRKGAGYHDLNTSHTMPSALSIRKYLEEKTPEVFCEVLAHRVPQSHMELWDELLSRRHYLFPSDFTKELRYRLLSESRADFTAYADVTRELSDKLTKNILLFSDWDDLCMRAKSKEISYSRISRALCHILLGITAQDIQTARCQDYVPYARILGFQKSAQPLLSVIKKKSEIPLISKLADAYRLLPESDHKILQKDITAAHIYESVMAAKCNFQINNEYKRQILIL